MTGDTSWVRTAPRARSPHGRDAVRSAAETRGHAELARGRRQLYDGPVGDARESLLLAASLLAADAPDGAETARLFAADAAWAAGDVPACLATLDGADTAARASDYAALDDAPVRTGADRDDASPLTRATAVPAPPPPALTDRAAATPTGPGNREPRPSSDEGGGPDVREPGPYGRGGGPDRRGPDWSRGEGGPDVREPGPYGGGPGPGWPRDPFVRDYRDGMRALLARRPEEAVGPLRRVLEQAWADGRPERLLRAAAAALLLGDLHAARSTGARALAAARNAECTASEARALEYLAYGELRAGRHAQARHHAEEGVRAALAAGRRNTAASHHAMLALAASIEGDTAAVAGYAGAALRTARRHGLAQAATLAEWAIARADLARGRPLDAADRLGPLVGPGPRRGHFAVWMLAVPCFVEAAVLAGQPDDARGVVADLAQWAAFGADPHAPAQLARCRALLAVDDAEADDLYLRALALHDASGGDFERARTELLYGRWLRRRRRLREARARLGAALVGFERCGAGAWAAQTRGELRANGAASGAASGSEPAGGLSRLTPQQLRIARHVAEGATNREVAQRLAVSTRTVDYHLRNVFAVLGVRSRVELARMVDQESR
ncbi:hypothetical protein GCM10010423_55370 [Streptomyces levis]|uniref:HTH luxR-type domain-containing protein n=1 Tax=Streptomyces levis TaxID=285566 RepID=A0ABN3NZX2_9ACTN